MSGNAGSSRAVATEPLTPLRELVAAADLPGRVDRHPFGMLAAAAGVGYMLGGGLFTPTTARVLRLGFKLAALPLVRDQLLTLAERAVDRRARREEPVESPTTG